MPTIRSAAVIVFLFLTDTHLASDRSRRQTGLAQRTSRRPSYREATEIPQRNRTPLPNQGRRWRYGLRRRIQPPPTRGQIIPKASRRSAGLVSFQTLRPGSFFTEALVPAITHEDPALLSLRPWRFFSTKLGMHYPVSSLPRPIREAAALTTPRLWEMAWKRGWPTLITHQRSGACAIRR